MLLLRSLPLLLLPISLWPASNWVLVRTVDGKQLEGETTVRSVKVIKDGATKEIRLEEILSIQSADPASAWESERIKAGLAAIQGQDRSARDQAVEELTQIGLPVMTPLLKTLKDTDQHEPRPLYRLFERLIPSYADEFDRTLSLVRLKSGEAIRGKISGGPLDLKTAAGKETLDPPSVRSIAVRQHQVRRSILLHSLRHSQQIEYLDTAVVLTAASKVESAARGLVRLSWDADVWASDADGLKKPAPNYQSHLFDGQPFGALIGRIGSKGEVFFIGKKAAKSGLAAGRLQLAINDNRHWQNNLGTFYVTISVTEAYDLGDAQ